MTYEEEYYDDAPIIQLTEDEDLMKIINQLTMSLMSWSHLPCRELHHPVDWRSIVEHLLIQMTKMKYVKAIYPVEGFNTQLTNEDHWRTV